MNMSLALVTLSHSPLMNALEPQAGVHQAVDDALEAARGFVQDFSPELVVAIAPDHYNGYFYDLMPPFCVGMAAQGVGDYGSHMGPLTVDREAAQAIVREVLAADIDIAYSERMYVDHGMAQPLEILFGSAASVPVVPVFINSVAEPLGPVSRARSLGRALGQAALTLNRRVLFVGSGGLSHDPPVPELETAPPEVAERLIAGRNPTREQRAEREGRIIEAARQFATGSLDIRPLNPAWDQQLMALLAANDLASIDSWPNEDFVEHGGRSSHEVRTWIAAYAALGTAGDFAVESSFYAPIPEWIAGFGVTTARPLVR
jgi:2,3-dihydroxyphenylpropionate 1,2-dioxygenase